MDKNKKRGVSAIRSTGPRSTRGLWEYPLPVPVAREAQDLDLHYPDAANHGLWGFFDESKKAMLEPEEEIEHGKLRCPGSIFDRHVNSRFLTNPGRSWTYAELSWKSYEDLHALYWVCVKEMNRCHTREAERLRLRAGYGDLESSQRRDVVSLQLSVSSDCFFDDDPILSLADMNQPGLEGMLKILLAMILLLLKVSEPNQMSSSHMLNPVSDIGQLY
jgi:hypothetical protein